MLFLFHIESKIINIKITCSSSKQPLSVVLVFGPIIACSFFYYKDLILVLKIDSIYIAKSKTPPSWLTSLLACKVI